MRMTTMMMNAAASAVLTVAPTFAHCDSLDGPVVKAARNALASGDVNLVLPWVQSRDETTIRKAFTRTLSVRGLNPDAENLADTWFYETVVRVHRAGEGAPYEGLKPAGADPGPAVRAADKAIETGSARTLEETLSAGVREQLDGRFHRVLESKGYKPSDVTAGREYVAAYVNFIHFAERLHKVLTPGGEHESEHEH